MTNLHFLAKAGETWVLVANGSRAAVFTIQTIDRHAAPGSEPGTRHQLSLKPIEGMGMNAESLGKYDLGHHAPARVVQSGTSNASTSEPRETPQEHIKRNFAKDIAQAMNEAAAQNLFAHLVLVASPSVLAEIRSSLTKQASQCIVAEHAADLTHHSGPDLLKGINHLLEPDAIAS